MYMMTHHHSPSMVQFLIKISLYECSEGFYDQFDIPRKKLIQPVCPHSASLPHFSPTKREFFTYRFRLNQKNFKQILY